MRNRRNKTKRMIGSGGDPRNGMTIRKVGYVSPNTSPNIFYNNPMKKNTKQLRILSGNPKRNILYKTQRITRGTQGIISNNQRNQHKSATVVKQNNKQNNVYNITTPRHLETSNIYSIKPSMGRNNRNGTYRAILKKTANQGNIHDTNSIVSHKGYFDKSGYQNKAKEFSTDDRHSINSIESVPSVFSQSSSNRHSRIDRMRISPIANWNLKKKKIYNNSNNTEL